MIRFLIKNCLLLLVVGLLGCKSTAAPVLSPEPGDRVRITVPDLRLEAVEGTLMSPTIDTLVVDALHVLRMSVSKYEVRGGKKSHAVEGALVGALLGGGIGLAVMNAEVEKNGCLDVDDSPCLIAAAGVGVILGGLIGAAIGYAYKTDRWVDQRQVLLPDRIASPKMLPKALGSRIVFIMYVEFNRICIG